jgi:hypothetical protein
MMYVIYIASAEYGKQSASEAMVSSSDGSSVWYGMA